MREEAVAESRKTFLHAVAQVFADATALLNGLSVIALQQTLGGVRQAAWQARAVKQSVENGEVVESLFLKNGVEVEFNILRSHLDRLH